MCLIKGLLWRSRCVSLAGLYTHCGVAVVLMIRLTWDAQDPRAVFILLFEFLVLVQEM